MKITVESAARDWFKDEFSLKSGYGIHLFGKVYGQTSVHDGFSVGVEAVPIEDVATQTTSDGITFFTTGRDEWFFAGYNLQIGFNEKLAEPEYQFKAIA